MKYLLIIGLNLLATSSKAGTKEASNLEGFQAARQYSGELLNDKESFTGQALEIIDVADYTYVQFAHGKEKSWLATSRVAVKKGDLVSFENPQTMHKFHSKTLKRTFDQIHFVTQLNVQSQAK